MDTVGELNFTVNDRIGDTNVSPPQVPLSLLSEFAKEVEQFLKGSGNSGGGLNVAIVPGSLGLQPCATPSDPTFDRDIELLQREDTLDFVDPKRRHVVEQWQARAKKNPNRTYIIGNSSSRKIVRITKDSRYRSTAAAAWVDVERFLVGEIEDMGGASKPNVHVRLDGQKLTISTTVDTLRKIEKSLVYKQSILHVKAQENIENGSLRNVTLVSAELFSPAVDVAGYERAQERTKSAWDGVEEAAAWVRGLRGN